MPVGGIQGVPGKEGMEHEKTEVGGKVCTYYC